MKKTIGIAGLGWLGKPLANKYMSLGYRVKGTVTSAEKARTLQKKGFDAFVVELTETGITGAINEFLNALDTLVIMIPPGLRRNTGADYVKKMTHLLEAIKKAGIPQCIFISSTSVYGDAQGMVTEKDLPQPDTEAGRQLVQVEQLFFTAPFATSIVRFGGLIGGSRQPARYVAGRDQLRGGHAPVNLIHREDCIHILTHLIQQQAYGHIFNAVYPEHPLKESYYTQKTAELGLEPPHYSTEDEEAYKQIDSVNLEKVLGYTFKATI